TLFAPPNVKGWPGGRTWLNTSTLLERANFAGALAMGSIWTDPATGPSSATAIKRLAVDGAANQSPSGNSAEEPAPPRAYDAAPLLQEERVERAVDIVRALLDFYLPGGIRPESQAKLEAFVSADNPKGPALERRVRETVHAILTMPEYQLA